ncbi:hypothetical protein [Agrococcus beijingensis]|uniref:hypothetical protein n=1 Tax=Agrococcus beijingensis TaxID=3068634 RepID=UPI002740A299|nr:hypothetical protein [Agrococcus sp. REN33]
MEAKQGSRMPADAPSARQLATAGLQLGAALVLHIALSLLLALTAAPELGAAMGAWPLDASAPGDVLPGWAELTVGPAAAWAVLVLARARLQGSVSGFWFACAAGLVAVASFALVLGAGLSSPEGAGPGMVAAAWLLVPCAIVVAALTALVQRSADRLRAQRRSARRDLGRNGV